MPLFEAGITASLLAVALLAAALLADRMAVAAAGDPPHEP